MENAIQVLLVRQEKGFAVQYITKHKKSG